MSEQDLSGHGLKDTVQDFVISSQTSQEPPTLGMVYAVNGCGEACLACTDFLDNAAKQRGHSSSTRLATAHRSVIDISNAKKRRDFRKQVFRYNGAPDLPLSLISSVHASTQDNITDCCRLRTWLLAPYRVVGAFSILSLTLHLKQCGTIYACKRWWLSDCTRYACA